MKTIYIDITITLRAHFLTGIQRVVREVTKYMILNETKSESSIVLLNWDKETKLFEVIDNTQYLDWLDGKRTVKECKSGQTLKPTALKKNTVFAELDAAWNVKNIPAEILFPILKKRGIKLVTYIYDLIPIRYPQFASKETLKVFMKYIDLATTYADTIVTDSQYVADDVKNLLQEAGRRIPHFSVAIPGADFKKININDKNIDESVKNISEKKPYILLVSTVEPRKNHKLILDAYDRFLKDEDLNIVFAGRMGWKSHDFAKRLFWHDDYGKRIFLCSGANDETISYLYQKALVTAFPTYTEGFGLPAVESLLAGTPVILSDIPVLHEAAGEYGQYFEVDNIEEFANVVKKYLNDNEFYENEKRKIGDYKPQTWDACGDAVMNACL